MRFPNRWRAAVSARVVIPEWLDHLPADDPAVVRSRRDLRRINALMGNERWICRQIRKFHEPLSRGICEIGAGQGDLCARLAAMLPTAAVTALDLAPRPATLDPRIRWLRGDVFTMPPPAPGGVVIANLFLHHFEGRPLQALGRWMDDAGVLIFNEPDRSRFPHFLGGLLHPFINPVTRHDMHVSIRAGFAPGEIAVLLGLDPGRWQIHETSTCRGSRRVIAWRT